MIYIQYSVYYIKYLIIYYAHQPHGKRDRESGFRGRRNRERRDISIYYTYRPEKQWRTTIRSVCRKRLQKPDDEQCAELGHRRRSIFCVVDDVVVVAAGDWPTRRAAVLPLSLFLFRIPSLFYSNNTTHKRTPVYYMFFKRFRINFSLSYSFPLFLFTGSFHDFYIYLLFVASPRASIPANFG